MAKIVHSVPVWLPMTEGWLYNQVSYLPKQIESYVVCHKTENLEQFAISNLHNVTGNVQWKFNLIRVLQRLGIPATGKYLLHVARESKADILHSHFGGTGWYDIGAAQACGLKHVVTFYGLDVTWLPRARPVWQKRYRELFTHIDKVLCEGTHMAKCLAELGCPKEKVLVHHIGVCVDAITFVPRVWHPGEPLRVLIAASFREKKGIPYALEALGVLQRNHPNLELGITIVGDANDSRSSQREKTKILTVLDQYDLLKCTKMLGFQPIPILFDEAYRHHIFLSPSISAADGDTEGGAPVTIIEMIATGMPIVSTTHCDIPGIIRHSETGLLAEERDVEGLVQHLTWYIDNPHAWHMMVTAGRRHIEAQFNAVIQGEQLARVYENLLR